MQSNYIAGITAIRLHYNKEGSETICIERQSNYENLNRFYYGMDTDLHGAREVISFTLIELLIKSSQ